MPEPTEAVSSDNVKTETAPQPVVAEQTTKANQSEAGKTPLSEILDGLNLPDEIKNRISPPVEAVAPEPEKPEDPPPAEPETPEVEKPEAISDETEDEEEEGENAAPQTPKVDGRLKRINRLTKQKRAVVTALGLDPDNASFEDALVEVGKLVSKKSEPESQVNGQNGHDAPSIPTRNRALAYVNDEQTLDNEVAKAEAIIAWCDENEDGVTLLENGVERFVEPKEVRSWRKPAEAVTRNSERRRFEILKFNSERAGWDAEAKKRWPAIFDPRTPDYQRAQAYKVLFPETASHPRGNFAVGLAISGEEHEEQKAKNGKNGSEVKATKDIDPKVFTAPRVPIAPHAPEPPSRSKVKSSQTEYNEAMTDLTHDQDNNVNHLARMFAALESQKRPGARVPART